MFPQHSPTYDRDCPVIGALRELPVSLRVPFVMRRMAQASSRDIAEALVISPRLAERQIRLASELVGARMVQMGIPRDDVDGLIDARLELPPAEEFVGRLMTIIRQMPPPSGKLTASDRAERLTGAIVTIVAATASIGAAAEVLRAIAGR